jgi:hypothetical protein
MAIEYQIDRDRQVVIAKVEGRLESRDIYAYQGEVWSRSDVAGYDELVDMTIAELVTSPSPEQVRELARISAAMDSPEHASKFAIVAPRSALFGLGRMYQTHRELDEHSTKKVGVFRSMEEAVKLARTGESELKRCRIH